MGYGNTYGKISREPRPYRTVKNSSASYDNHALAGAKFFGPTMTGDTDAQTDEEYGYSFSGPSNLTPENVNGNDKISLPDPGPVRGLTDRNAKRGNGDPTPGGGW